MTETEKTNVIISPYLFFNGNAKEAVHYYAEVFSGKIIYEGTFADTPTIVPEDWKDKIFHAALTFGDNAAMIMISDIEKPDENVTFGNHNHVSIKIDNLEKVQRIFDRLLQDGGKLIAPFELQFFGSYNGTVVDKFDVSWILSHRPL